MHTLPILFFKEVTRHEKSLPYEMHTGRSIKRTGSKNINCDSIDYNCHQEFGYGKCSATYAAVDFEHQVRQDEVTWLQ